VFRSLIGKLQTGVIIAIIVQVFPFRSLIGKLQTLILFLDNLSFQNLFRSLIGKLQTANYFYDAVFAVLSFDPL